MRDAPLRRWRAAVGPAPARWDKSAASGPPRGPRAKEVFVGTARMGSAILPIRVNPAVSLGATSCATTVLPRLCTAMRELLSLRSIHQSDFLHLMVEP